MPAQDLGGDPGERDQVTARVRRRRRSGRPPASDAYACCRRNVVERWSVLATQRPGPATRHDKRAITDRAAVTHCIILG